MRSNDLILRRRSTVVVAVLSGCLLALVGAPRADPAFLGTNGRIAFTSDRDGAEDVYVMNADGTNQTQLTFAAAIDQYPTWSPNGTKIAFSSFREATQKLFTMNADGSGQTRVLDAPVFASGDEEPSWSRNGSRLAFRSDRELGDLHIWSVGANGAGLFRLTSTGMNINPVWSPATDRIAFASTRDGDDFELYTMDDVGQNVVQLTNNDAFDSNPDWSPSGTRIAFQSNRDGDVDIYVLNQDDSIDQLTNDPASDSAPAWSPDGTKIAFQSNRDGDFEIYTMNADGSGVLQLTNNDAVDRVADWQPLTSGGDATPPQLSLPGPIAVDATSSAGAAVSFVVRAIDVVDPSPTLSCSPASGATFPIGSTLVSCTATDRAGNRSTGAFAVIVVGARAQMERLFQEVIAASTLSPTQKAFLAGRLQAALTAFNPDSRAHNCIAWNALGFFEIVVSSLRGNGIEPALADRWLADARRIRSVLRC